LHEPDNCDNGRALVDMIAGCRFKEMDYL
jgi:hypothetical protein